MMEIYSFCLVLLLIYSAESGTLEQQYAKIQEIQTQLSLRGTEHEHLDTKLDSILQEIHKATMNRQDNSLENKLKQMETTLANVVQTQQALKDENEALVAKVAVLENIKPVFQSLGTSYTRWGRTTCPGNGSVLMYSGYAAGGHYTHKGRSPNMLCLPQDPVWAKFDDSENSIGGYVYGVEYEHQPGRANSIFGKSLLDQDAPCVVCDVKVRTRNIMIPGRTTCYDGWTREYWGYLMTGHYTHAGQADYHCIDADPETITGGDANLNGYLLYFVEVRGDGLKSPPYIKGRELPCVVCTK